MSKETFKTRIGHRVISYCEELPNVWKDVGSHILNASGALLRPESWQPQTLLDLFILLKVDLL